MGYRSIGAGGGDSIGSIVVNMVLLMWCYDTGASVVWVIRVSVQVVVIA